MAINSSLLLTECQSSTTNKRNLRGSVGDIVPTGSYRLLYMCKSTCVAVFRRGVTISIVITLLSSYIFTGLQQLTKQPRLAAGT